MAKAEFGEVHTIPGSSLEKFMTGMPRDEFRIGDRVYSLYGNILNPANRGRVVRILHFEQGIYYEVLFQKKETPEFCSERSIGYLTLSMMIWRSLKRTWRKLFT
ncbi:MAG: hypothetical protein PHI88_01605 [Candidatus Pacebacteria bacterium]|nr:hypothetical protein [Candidatus Paceibacterota bacterium]